MGGDKSPKTYKELVEALKDLFDEIGPETPDEIDAVLREAGYDPDEIAARMKQTAENAWAESPFNWRNRARQELEEATSAINNSPSPPKRSRIELLTAIETLVSKLSGNPQNLAVAHFRNLDRSTDEDLVSLLSELEYLAEQQAKRASKDKQESA